MAPSGWGTPDQKLFFLLWMPEYMTKKAEKRLDEFWPKMRLAWYSEFPEEASLGYPVQEVHLDPNAPPVRRLTPEETAALSIAITVRDKFKQLQNSFKNGYSKIRKQRGGVARSASSLAAVLFKSFPKRKRRLQVLEVYQKQNKAALKTALRDSEYDALNEAAQCRGDDGEWVDDEEDSIRVQRITAARKQRMKVFRRVVQQMWELEPEEYQESIRALWRDQIPETTTTQEPEDGTTTERTPEEYQLSLDESLSVAQMFCSEFGRMTGWVGTLLFAGPVPRLGGEVGMKSYSFGLTPGGVSFENAHPSWKKSVAQPLFKFARQAMTRETRVSRALFPDEEVETGPQGLAPVDPATPTPSQKTKKSKKGKKNKAAHVPEEATPDHAPPARRPRKSAAPKPATPVVYAPAPLDAVSAQEQNEEDLHIDAALPTMDSGGLTPPSGLTGVPFPQGDGIDGLDLGDEDYEALCGLFPEFPTQPDAGYSEVPMYTSPHREHYYPREYNSENGSPQGPELFLPGQEADGADAWNGRPMQSVDMALRSVAGTPISMGSGALDSSSLPSSLQERDGMAAPAEPAARDSSFGAVRSLLTNDAHAPAAQEENAGCFGVRPPVTDDARANRFGAIGAPGANDARAGLFGGATNVNPFRSRTPFTNNAPASPLGIAPTNDARVPVHDAHASPAGAAAHASPPGAAPAAPGAVRSLPRPLHKSPSDTGGAVTFGRDPQFRALYPPSGEAPTSTEKGLATPLRRRHGPATSSPLTAPPLQAEEDELVDGRDSPPPGALPPRLRPSPSRAPPSPSTSRAPPSPPVYPQSRPMSNAPKPPVIPLSPASMRRKMAALRATKTGGKKAAAGKKKAGGKKKKAVDEGISAGQDAAGVQMEPEERHEPPALVFSQTNNNRARALEQTRREREKQETAKAARAGDIQLQNPAKNNYDTVVVVPLGRSRRAKFVSTHRGEVQSLVDKRQAEEDAALVKRFGKRKAEGENEAPQARK
ncbi:hypothetical protein C8R47DRAFT_1082891 [Mycena vitilis]|nr:hypothetical protein C8R47DRAFT_1082891 [Mycena vitilis]